MLIRGKRGSHDFLWAIVIFSIINLVFLSMTVYFVNKQAEGDLVYEKLYTQKIALALDSAVPKTDIQIDISDLIKRAEKNGLKGEQLKEIIQINDEKNTIFISLDGKSGTRFVYFSNYRTSGQINIKEKTIRMGVENDK